MEILFKANSNIKLLKVIVLLQKTESMIYQNKIKIKIYKNPPIKSNLIHCLEIKSQ